MKKSYISNFLKIYFWQGLSILLNMVSMLVVVPTLTSDPTIYGIYMLCMSFNIFLNYADIGFINAGFKYAAEHFSRGELKNEMSIIGFVSFILAIFLLIPFAFFMVCSYNPDLLIGGLTADNERHIASQLLFIQGIFSFSIILNKIGVIAYGIRLENHKINQIGIIANLTKIAAIFYFFSSSGYNIVGYFLFGKIVEAISFLIIISLTTKRYNYDLLFIIKSFRFSKPIFEKTKDLAIVTFVGSMLWIVYYELDSVIITKFLGAEIFAFFAIGLALTKFIRSFFSIIFGPFNARFNHIAGLNQLNSLNDYFIKTLKTVFPVLFLFVLCITTFREAIIISWVGNNYNLSVDILLFLALAMLLTAIRNLSVTMATSLVKTRLLLFISLGMAIGYWSFILITIKYFGVLSFAYSRFLVFVISDLIFLSVLCHLISINFYKLIFDLFKPIVVPSIIILISSHLYLSFFSFYLNKSKINVLLVILSVAAMYLISLLTLYFTSREVKDLISKLAKQLYSTLYKPVLSTN